MKMPECPFRKIRGSRRFTRRSAVGTVLMCIFLPIASARPAGGVQSRSRNRTVFISLTGGSSVVGRILGMKNGTIRVRTAALGVLSVPVSNIRSLRFQAALPADRQAGTRKKNGASVLGRRQALVRARSQRALATSRGGTAAMPLRIAGYDFSGLMRSIAGNPRIMQELSNLQNDPEIRRVLQDPAVIRAVQKGDILSLMKNPKVLKLVTNPKLRKLSREVAGGH